MKILVTGANGYIGQHVVRTLLDCGHTVVASDIRSDNIDSRARFVACDIFRPAKNLYERFGRPDACLHFTWRYGFVHDSPVHLHDIPAHLQFLSSLIDSGLKQLVVMGSMHEVGYHEGAVDENTPCHPTSQYAIAKCTLRERLAEVCAGRCTFQWLRGFYVLGDDRKNHSIFSKILEAVDRGDTSFPINSGRNRYDFIDVHELSRQITAVASQRAVNGIINVCSGHAVPLGRMVEKYIADHRLPIVLDYGAYPDRPYDSPEIYGDPTKINSIMAAANKNQETPSTAS